MNQDSSWNMAAHSLRARFKETVSDAILEATEQLAAEVGLQGASLQLIAQRAGIAVGTIYNHFADRDELFVVLFARRREELLTTIDAACKKTLSAPFADQLQTFVRAVFGHFDTRRAFLRIALEDGPPKETRKAKISSPHGSMEQLRARAERIVRVGLKEKKLRTEGAELLPLFLISAIRAVLIAKIDSPKPFAEESDTVVKLFLRGASR